ncbi:MAG: hypothetical protein ACOX84_08990 [Methanothrix sp.]|uniref:hypothetical protein n=3 Tax=Methanothrix sp. TaxID=90426 RepID=UPI001BD52ED0
MIPRPGPLEAEWISLFGQGYHEVIAGSQDHRQNPKDFSRRHMEMLVEAHADCYRHYCCHDCLPLPERHHFNTRIQPTFSRIAGFERCSGIYVNPLPPEQAAAELIFLPCRRKINQLSD